MEIANKSSNPRHAIKRFLEKPTIKGSSEFYDYGDKGGEKEVLMKQREKYIVKALEVVLRDKDFAGSLLAHKEKPGEENAVRRIREEVYKVLSKQQGLWKETSVATLDALNKEYNDSAVDRAIVNYISHGDEKKILEDLREYSE